MDSYSALMNEVPLSVSTNLGVPCRHIMWSTIALAIVFADAFGMGMASGYLVNRQHAVSRNLFPIGVVGSGPSMSKATVSNAVLMSGEKRSGAFGGCVVLFLSAQDTHFSQNFLCGYTCYSRKNVGVFWRKYVLYFGVPRKGYCGRRSKFDLPCCAVP